MKIKQTILLIALMLFVGGMLSAQVTEEKKEQTQWKAPEFQRIADVHYSKHRNRIYVSDQGKYDIMWSKFGKKKHEEIQNGDDDTDYSEHWDGVVYEMHPFDYRNRIALPNLRTNSPTGMAAFGDSLYIGDYRDIYGYDLSTSSTFSVINLDSLGYISLRDCVVDSNGYMYFAATDLTPDTNKYNRIIKFDYRTETVENIDLPQEYIESIAGMYYDKDSHSIHYTTWEPDSCIIGTLSLSSNSITRIVQTPYIFLSQMMQDSAGDFYVIGDPSWSQISELIKYNSDFSEVLSTYDPPGLSALTNLFYNHLWHSLDVFDTEDYLQMRILYEPPELIYPANNATNVGTNTVLKHQFFDLFSWDERLMYTIQVSEFEDYTTNVVDTAIVYYKERPVTHITTDSLELNTTYYWRVKAENLYYRTGWSESSTFTTTTSLRDAPIIISPLEGDTIRGNSKTFTWHPVPNAESYLLFCGRDFYETTDTSYIINQNPSSEISYKFWKVKAVGPNTESDWSEPVLFCNLHNYLMYAPFPKYPKTNTDGIESSVEIVWRAVDGVDYYNIVLLSPKGYEYFQVDSNSLYIDSLELRTYYNWSVQGFNDSANTSQKHSFFRTAYEPVDPPGLISPSDENGKVKRSPILTWEDMEADIYNLNISEVGNSKPNDKLLKDGQPVPWFLNNPIIEEGLEETEYQIGEWDLNDKTYYSWRVQAIKNENQSKWSDVDYFLTDFSIGVDDNDLTSEFELYPNPANEFLFVTFPLNTKVESITVYNVLGIEQDIVDNSYRNQKAISLNTTSLVPGMYFIVFNTGLSIIKRSFLISE